MSPNFTLYAALALYAAGTIVALATLFMREKRPQHIALGIMIAGFIAHTVWIGTICVRTHHPPLTNLPEAAGFMAWVVFAVELALFIRYRVHAASFFVYPLVLMLLTLSAVVREPFVKSPAAVSRLFITHILLTTTGVAGLLIGLAFGALAWAQDRALKSKQRGALCDWVQHLHPRHFGRHSLVVPNFGRIDGFPRQASRRGSGLGALRHRAAVLRQRHLPHAAHRNH